MDPRVEREQMKREPRLLKSSKNMKTLLAGLLLSITYCLCMDRVVCADDVKGKAVMGEELRNGVYELVPLRDDPPAPSRRSESWHPGESQNPPQSASVDWKKISEENRREAARLLKPVDRIPEALKYPTQGNILLKPTGTAFFNVLRSAGGVGDESIAQRLGDTPFAASKSSAEDLYRTTYLLQAASKARGLEDARFLADQAGLAINAEPILVVIPDQGNFTEIQDRIRKVDKLKDEVLEAQRTFVQETRTWSGATGDVSSAKVEVEKRKDAVEQAMDHARKQLTETPANKGSTLDPENDPDVKRAKAMLEESKHQLQKAAAGETNAKAKMEEAKQRLEARIRRFVNASVADSP
jgi:sRNA-binding protein